jgi:hypothetical protein
LARVALRDTHAQVLQLHSRSRSHAGPGNFRKRRDQRIKAAYPEVLGEELKRLVQIVSDVGDLVGALAEVSILPFPFVEL